MEVISMDKIRKLNRVVAMTAKLERMLEEGH